MVKPQANHAALPHGPDADAAMAQYEERAGRYDWELAAFEPVRRAAIEQLAIGPGQSVVDVGCGTGLSLPLLGAAVAPRGRVLGVEPSPGMLSRARARVVGMRMPWIELQQSVAELADFSGIAPVDAMLFHFTHDVLRNPRAVQWLMSQVKPGGRVVAAGLQWAPLWAVPANLFVWSAAMYSTTCLEGLACPWDLLRPYLCEVEEQSLWAGSIYIAAGRRRD
ncbi:MAG: class I SAM-dependent methyltransferase [Aquincola tertiaricarbonis]